MDVDDEFAHRVDADEGRSRDTKIDEAKKVIFEKYFSEGVGVFYSRQIEIWMERDFFHWITNRALSELAKEGKISSTIEEFKHFKAHFYYPKKHRYPRRQISEIMKLIARFSDSTFTRAVGHHGELLVESAFARTGFRILQQKVRSVGGVSWEASKHDLDFLVERDNVRYGVEVKNQLGYIDQTEFQIKLDMCSHLGIRPMFITRMMPKNYIRQVNQNGGFVLITQNQNYPLLGEPLAREVTDTLMLPVAVIQRLPDTALSRFEQFHRGVAIV